MANNKPRFEKMASPAAAIAGTSSRSGCPSRNNSAATGNTAMGSMSARPMGCSFAMILFIGCLLPARAPAQRFPAPARAAAIARQASSVSARTCALSCGISVGTTDNSLTPRPSNTGTAAGSAASPPHTATGLPCTAAPLQVMSIMRRTAGWTAVDARRQLGVTAIHRQRVLREIVGADREKVDFARNGVGEHGRGRCFDHGAERGARHPSRAQLRPTSAARRESRRRR